MKKVKVAMVSYLNAIPFRIGLEKNTNMELDIKFENPAICAQLFFENKVDISLLPVGALIEKNGFEIFSDYCIGSNGKVMTVCLYSNNPLNEINKIYLDSHSRTSVLLTKLLMKEFGHENIIYDYIDTENQIIETNEAKLMIGDKVFRSKNKYNYVFDLSELWKDLTGLPFVFAVWVKNSSVNNAVSNQINNSLKFGTENINLVLENISNEMNLNSYFNHYISYQFDRNKKEALKLFFEKLKEFNIE